MAKKRKKRLSFLIVKIGVVAFVAYGVVSIVSTQYQLAQRNREEAELDGQIAAMQANNEELDALLNASEDNYDDYILKLVREKLNYVYPDEMVLKDVSGN